MIGALVLVAVGVGGVSSAESKVIVGVGDQQARMFDDPSFKALKVRYSRYIVPWDVMSRPKDKAALEAWLAGAKRDGIRPLIAFNHSNATPRKLPSVAQYRQAVSAFNQAYTKQYNVDAYSVWNEVNHSSQPTKKNPRRAAQYYNALRSVLGANFKIIAADVLDTSNMRSYLQRFIRGVKGPKSRLIWGLHNYKDVNRRSTLGITTMMNTVKGPIWLTETGGLVKFVGKAFRYNPARASKALNYLLSSYVKKRGIRGRVKRAYLYNYHGLAPSARFDAGLINPNGSRRPGYNIAKRFIR
jgi:hypothetical protein